MLSSECLVHNPNWIPDFFYGLVSRSPGILVRAIQAEHGLQNDLQNTLATIQEQVPQ